jgi:hypothetical protein
VIPQSSRRTRTPRPGTERATNTAHFVNAPGSCVLNCRGLSAATGPGKLRTYDTRHPATHQSNPASRAYRPGPVARLRTRPTRKPDQSNPRMRDIETIDSELRLVVLLLQRGQYQPSNWSAYFLGRRSALICPVRAFECWSVNEETTTRRLEDNKS